MLKSSQAFAKLPPREQGRELAVLGCVAALSGVLTGLVGAAFQIFLLRAEAARATLLTWAHQWPLIGWVIPVGAAALAVGLAAWLVLRFAPLAAGSGVQHVEAVMRGEAAPAPLAVLPVKFVGGVLAIGSGLALGREGPTVQLGATIGARIAQRFSLSDDGVRLIQSAAAGAGLGVAFNTPLGGIAFVFEELAQRFGVRLMVATLAACASGVFVSRFILGDVIDFNVPEPAEPLLATVLVCVVLGTLLGLLGAAYNRTLIIFLDRFATWTTVPTPLRAAGVGGVVGLVAWFEPLIVGGGDPIIQSVLERPVSISLLLVVLVARWFLGPYSYSAQTPGGLFAPLLVVGAVFGSLFAQVAAMVVPGLPLSPAMGALVGMAAFFTGVVRSPFTGTLLVLGMTGTATPLIPILAACVAATIVPYALGNDPIYDTLRARMPKQALPQSEVATPPAG
ncbi:MAG: ClC family H(+)/Cl(-) exchange transporter [Thermomicrobiales bacterium]|nr:ClC family H(+)/Cl(-) exchange transporter [Thermomicrobiales bacterium]